MQAHIHPASLDRDGQSGLRRAAMFRSGAAVGVVLLVFAISVARLDKPVSIGAPTEAGSAPATQTQSPDESSRATRDHESAEWVQGTQG